MYSMKKTLSNSLLFALALLLSSAPALASDSRSSGAFAKFCEEAIAAVDRNTDMFADDLILPFNIGPAFPTNALLNNMRSKKPTLLSNLSSYKELKGSKESGLEGHVRNYDMMVTARMAFFQRAADVTGSEFQARHNALREAIRKWNENYKDLQLLVSFHQKTANALKLLKKDYDDLKGKISQPGPQALSSNNALKKLFENKTLAWPPQRNQMENLKIPEIYDIRWFTNSLELNSDVRRLLEYWDSYVKKHIDPSRKTMEIFKNAMIKINEQNKVCASFGTNLKSDIVNDRNSPNSLDFGLRQALIDAGTMEEGMFKHVVDELGRASKDYEEFDKFLNKSQVRDILLRQYFIYYDAKDNKVDTMYKSFDSFGKAMVEYRRMFRDIAKN